MFDRIVMLTTLAIVSATGRLADQAIRLTDSLHDRKLRDERGQASAEYALVLLGAAGVALLFVAWATSTNRVGNLLNTVFDAVTSRVR